jgi:hypothetical protein
MEYKDACSLIDLYTSGKLFVQSDERIEEYFVRAVISPPVDDSKCFVMMMTGIVYNNPLLNYPALMESFSKTHSHSEVSRLIDLTSVLSNDSREVIEEICNSEVAISMLCMLMGEEFNA